MASNSGLYIHIPFCRKKCSYCHFYSTSRLELRPDYIKALILEMSRDHSAFGTFDTIYFGGGTPSLLDIPDIDAILSAILRSLPIAPHPEITVELNPADRDISWFQALRNLGVNRLNIGIQSLDDSDLSFLGRRHTSDEALAAIDHAQAAGFENVGFDLIYNLPGQTITSWKKTLNRALSYCPAHLSCYELTVEEGTPLAMRYEKHELALPDEARQGDFFELTSDYLREAGYLHYEVSNFARAESFLSRHNCKYWNRTPYLGLGPSAHSYLGGIRRWNDASLDGYLAALFSGETPPGGEETLTGDQMRLEDLFLGLRTREGIDFRRFMDRHDYDLRERRKDMITGMIREGHLNPDGEGVRPTAKGFAVADRLALMLFNGR